MTAPASIPPQPNDSQEIHLTYDHDVIGTADALGIIDRQH